MVWYLEGGYWREDAEIYLTDAERVFSLVAGTASKKNQP